MRNEKQGIHHAEVKDGSLGRAQLLEPGNVWGCTLYLSTQSYSALFYACVHKARRVIHQKRFETDRGLCTESRGQPVDSYRVWFFCHDEQAAIQTWMTGECFRCINRLWPLTACTQISVYPHAPRGPIRNNLTHLDVFFFSFTHHFSLAALSLYKWNPLPTSCTSTEPQVAFSLYNPSDQTL